MKKKILVIAAALGAQAGTALAQSTVTVFGVLDEYIEVANNGRQTVPRVESGGIYGSRLGFKGSEDLGNGNRAIFHMEAGINADDGTSGQGGLMFGRQIWAGIGGAYGELTFGRQYSGYFNTLATYGLGGGMGWGNASISFSDVSVMRVNNSVVYTSPRVKGFVLRAMHAFGEVADARTVGDIESASLDYAAGPFSTNIAFESRKTTANNMDRFYAFGAAYQFPAFKTALLVQLRRDDIGARENNAYELSTVIPFTTSSLLIDLGYFQDKARAGGDAASLILRYDYNLSKRTTLYTGFARFRNGSTAAFAINGATSYGVKVAAGDDPSSTIFGVRLLF
jgi:predicted porin